jgi:hypothetical protein
MKYYTVGGNKRKQHHEKPNQNHKIPALGVVAEHVAKYGRGEFHAEILNTARCKSMGISLI